MDGKSDNGQIYVPNLIDTKVTTEFESSEQASKQASMRGDMYLIRSTWDVPLFSLFTP